MNPAETIEARRLELGLTDTDVANQIGLKIDKSDGL